MPWDEPEAGDPMELRAAAMPGDADAMAEAIVDEYVRFGLCRERLMEMFRDPFFRMTHAIWREKGDAYCAALIDRVAARWGHPEGVREGIEARGSRVQRGDFAPPDRASEKR